MPLLRSLNIGCLGLLLAGMFAHVATQAAAQTASDPVTPLSRALACLTRSSRAPAELSYPPAALARKEGGAVSVQLAFANASAGPEVTILARPRASRFDDLVIAHARQFRVSCIS